MIVVFHFWSPYKRPGKSYLLGNILSNYGNTLEIMVPSITRNYINGWTNYSCMVTSQNIYENKVVYHVSKSVILNNIVVKEQRVYGSRYGNILLFLRCILMNLEIKYQIKNHSNLIIQKQFYSKRCETTFEDNNLIINNKYTQLEPWFITGFADAEGCFLVIIRKAPKNKLGWQLEPNFIINLHKRDIELLKLIQYYFRGVGRIGKERNGSRDFTVGSLDQILGKIIPHFDKYPLKTKKLQDYLLFREVVMMMKRREHLTVEGLDKIVNIRATLNRGLTPTLKAAFPNSVAVSTEFPHFNSVQTTDTQDNGRLHTVCVENQSTLSLHPEWVAGFTSGDGCFKVSIRESKAYKVGSRVIIIFVLTQHIRDELVLKSLVNFFACGQVYSYKHHSEFICQSFINNYTKILPFFRKYRILGVKSLDFEDWDKVAEMIKTKAHITNEGFDKIRKIRARMNKGRYI